VAKAKVITFEMAFWLTFLTCTGGVLVWAVVGRLAWWDAWIDAMLGEE